jgi:hypothetical protein
MHFLIEILALALPSQDKISSKYDYDEEEMIYDCEVLGQNDEYLDHTDHIVERSKCDHPEMEDRIMRLASLGLKSCRLRDYDFNYNHGANRHCYFAESTTDYFSIASVMDLHYDRDGLHYLEDRLLMANDTVYSHTSNYYPEGK